MTAVFPRLSRMEPIDAKEEHGGESDGRCQILTK